MGPKLRLLLASACVAIGTAVVPATAAVAAPARPGPVVHAPGQRVGDSAGPGTDAAASPPAWLLLLLVPILGGGGIAAATTVRRLR